MADDKYVWLVGWLAGDPNTHFAVYILSPPSYHPILHSASLLHCTDLYKQNVSIYFLNVPGKLKFQTICKFKLGTMHLNTHELVQCACHLRGDLIEEVHTHKSERGNSHKSCQRRTPKSDCGLLQRLQHMTQNHRNILRAYSMKSIPVQISPDKIFLRVKLDSIAVSHYLKIFWLSLTKTFRSKFK